MNQEVEQKIIVTILLGFLHCDVIADESGYSRGYVYDYLHSLVRRGVLKYEEMHTPRKIGKYSVNNIDQVKELYPTLWDDYIEAQNKIDK